MTRREFITLGQAQALGRDHADRHRSTARAWGECRATAAVAAAAAAAAEDRCGVPKRLSVTGWLLPGQFDQAFASAPAPNAWTGCLRLLYKSSICIATWSQVKRAARSEERREAKEVGGRR